MTLAEIINNILSEISIAVKDRSHPFYTFSLATVDKNSQIRQRTVVLRNFDKNHKVIFYTDTRSPKVSDLIDHPQVSLLFYDPDRKLQIIVDGQATVKSSQFLPTDVRNDHSKRNYTSIPPPGTAILYPGKVDYSSRDIFFTAVEVSIEKMEYLKLDRSGHLRARFDREGEKWQGYFLAP